MNHKTSKVIIGFVIALIFVIGNYASSYAATKNDLEMNLNQLTKIVEEVEKTGTKKVAKKKIKEVKKIEKKIEKLKINNRVKKIAEEDANEVKMLCYEVRNNKKLTDLAKFKAENCKLRISSTQLINTKKNEGVKNLDYIIRKEAAEQLNNQVMNFNTYVLSVVASNKNYKTGELDDMASEIRSQVLSISLSYFEIEDYTRLDVDLMDIINEVLDSMQDFSKGKLTVGEYIKKRTKFADEYQQFIDIDDIDTEQI